MSFNKSVNQETMFKILNIIFFFWDQCFDNNFRIQINHLRLKIHGDIGGGSDGGFR